MASPDTIILLIVHALACSHWGGDPRSSPLRTPPMRVTLTHTRLSYYHLAVMCCVSDEQCTVHGVCLPVHTACVYLQCASCRRWRVDSETLSSTVTSADVTAADVSVPSSDDDVDVTSSADRDADWCAVCWQRLSSADGCTTATPSAPCTTPHLHNILTYRHHHAVTSHNGVHNRATEVLPPWLHDS